MAGLRSVFSDRAAAVRAAAVDEALERLRGVQGPDDDGEDADAA